jgi:hypothetical protein
MIPASLRQARNPNTKLYLNGPILSIANQPSGITTGIGNTVSISGFATATFDQNPNAILDGTITYQWYASTEPPSILIDSPKYVGTGTSTLTIHNTKSPQDNLDSFYLSVGYNSINNGYLNDPLSGEEINGPLNSNSVVLNVLPVITITKQPISRTIGLNAITKFEAEASISDERGYQPLQYYWTVDGVQTNSNSTTLTISESELGEKEVQFYAYADIDFDDTGRVDILSTRIIEASDVVTLTVVDPRPILKFEAFGSNVDTYDSLEVNFNDTPEFELSDTDFGSEYNTITVYASETNVELTLLVEGAQGLPGTTNVSGGEGGKSTIQYTFEKNIEHTILGTSNSSAIFLYRGSKLLFVVGQGGQGSDTNSGGDGGGVNIAGQDGQGTNPGTGGLRVDSGELSLNGIFGSIVNDPTLREGDSSASSPTGGKTISCTKGSYWINQGVSPCSDNSESNIKFRLSDGSEFIQSDEIIRGFKSGYVITSTEGSSVTGSRGGRGATGGNASLDGNNSGGGGSGYTDGTVTISQTQLGGRIGSSRIVFNYS